MNTAPCEDCGQTLGVRAFGTDHALLCPACYDRAARNVAAAETPAGAAPPTGDDPLAAARARALAFDGLSPDELRAFADAIYDQGPLGEPAGYYRNIARGLLSEVDRLTAARARDRALLELLERVATETYSGANEALLLMAKGRALDRLIAAWERLDADAARPPAGKGEETP